MMNPSIEYLRGCQVTPTKGCQVTPTFGMIPLNVLTDSELSHRDIVVYGFLACGRRGKFVSVGTRRIAECIHADRRNVKASIEQLVKRGHVKIREGPGRRVYELTSPLFSKVNGVDTDNVLDSNDLSESDTPKVAKSSTIKKLCPECHKFRYGQMAIGWCRTCNVRKNMESIARRVVREEKTA